MHRMVISGPTHRGSYPVTDCLTRFYLVTGDVSRSFSSVVPLVISIQTVSEGYT